MSSGFKVSLREDNCFVSSVMTTTLLTSTFFCSEHEKNKKTNSGHEVERRGVVPWGYHEKFNTNDEFEIKICKFSLRSRTHIFIGFL